MCCIACISLFLYIAKTKFNAKNKDLSEKKKIKIDIDSAYTIELSQVRYIRALIIVVLLWLSEGVKKVL